MNISTAMTLGALLGTAILTACAATGTSDPAAPATASAASRPAPENDQSRLAYGVGYFLGEEVLEGFRTDEIKVDTDLVARGFTDAVRQLDPAYDREDLDDVLEAVHQEMQRRMVARQLANNESFRRLHDANLERSRAFHAEHAARRGVVTLDSGGQYEILVPGQGPSPGPDDVVVATYRVETISGTVIDSVQRKRVIVAELQPGAHELVQLMRVGCRWKIAVPPHLAYGAAGEPPLIGPNETLLAEVELVEILGSREEVMR
ncbi:MAG: FKBP-type peptidyl-prolyl cis-trans isomerase N-terminal domain-containing protein [Planctomycetota bacterium]|jgi:FKBP-type peptidyl-prolyl cis-trans isomerase FklB